MSQLNTTVEKQNEVMDKQISVQSDTKCELAELTHSVSRLSVVCESTMQKQNRLFSLSDSVKSELSELNKRVSRLENVNVSSDEPLLLDFTDQENPGRVPIEQRLPTVRVDVCERAPLTNLHTQRLIQNNLDEFSSGMSVCNPQESIGSQPDALSVAGSSVMRENERSTSFSQGRTYSVPTEVAGSDAWQKQERVNLNVTPSEFLQPRTSSAIGDHQHKVQPTDFRPQTNLRGFGLGEPTVSPIVSDEVTYEHSSARRSPPPSYFSGSKSDYAQKSMSEVSVDIETVSHRSECEKQNFAGDERGQNPNIALSSDQFSTFVR